MLGRLAFPEARGVGEGSQELEVLGGMCCPAPRKQDGSPVPAGPPPPHTHHRSSDTGGGGVPERYANTPASGGEVAPGTVYSRCSKPESQKVKKWVTAEDREGISGCPERFRETRVCSVTSQAERCS